MTTNIWLLIGIVIILILVLLVYIFGNIKPTPTGATRAPPTGSPRAAPTAVRYHPAARILIWLLCIGFLVWALRSCQRSEARSLREEKRQMEMAQRAKWFFHQDVENPLAMQRMEISNFHDSLAVMEFRIPFREDGGHHEAHFIWNKNEAVGRWKQHNDGGDFRLMKTNEGEFAGWYTSRRERNPVPIRLKLE